jgi:hypothetical protein
MVPCNNERIERWSFGLRITSGCSRFLELVVVVVGFIAVWTTVEQALISTQKDDMLLPVLVCLRCA